MLICSYHKTPIVLASMPSSLIILSYVYFIQPGDNCLECEEDSVIDSSGQATGWLVAT